MIYLLYQPAGEPISKWTKTHISLNTVVSILAGTSRACLAFAISMCPRANGTYELPFYRTSRNIQEDMGMKAAMWNGFSPFTARQNLKPAFACATGNCTWANFTSIAVCSKCRDISGYVTKSSGP
ncbi:hypothetical protein FOC1_g10007802 [Fusarium oxysporum f. sp. cubense race 1]|uniref:Uncharacterized protein n=1 Tax=Fusarium oxysporum f. sp. cubense (strain race 1) TaxID=1229664 RepID=N4U8V2_FUSC1|nr:hypothetical protein FOC1_g10007802 [Fusarium oxysporum f. sp. cubense race 1]